MPRTEQQINDLQARLKALEQENALLIEQAEETQLLGFLAASVNGQADTEGLLENALERLASLKSLDLVALFRKRGEDYLIEQYYLTEDEARLQGLKLDLPGMAEAFYTGETARRLLPQLRLPCEQLLQVPFQTAVYGEGGLLFGIRQLEDDRLQRSQPMLCRAVDTLLLNLENRLLLQNYQQANIYLDQELEDRNLKLTESETLFRTVIEQAYEAFFLHDADGKILQVNQRACDNLGYSKEELLQLSVTDVASNLTSQQLKDFLSRFAEESHQRFRSFHRREDGQSFPVEVNVSRVSLAGENYYLALVQDISELVKIEDLQLQLDLLMDHLPDIVCMARPDGEVLYLNRAARELFGLGTSDLPELNLSELMPARYAKRCLQQHIPQAIDQGGWVGENLLISAAKELIPTLQTIVAPRDKAGQLAYIFCIERDLRELRRLEEQFVQAQKMEAIGTLVGGIAHDFNNLLAGIMGNLFLLLRRTEDGPQKERLKSVEQMCQNAADMISQLLIFARKDVVRIEPVQLKTFMQEFSKMYQVLIPESICYEMGAVAEDLVVLTDVSQLQQVLVNLLTNARDALAGRENPTIGVSLDVFDADEQFLERHREVSQRELVCISVIDNGCGIAAAVRDRIFDPFFTTKKSNKGTGLGLAMVFGAVRRQGGCIEIDSHQGQGTIVRVYLPRLLKGIEDIRQTGGGELDYGQGELILLADDDDFVRESHKEVLVQLGYRVLAVSDGVQALEAFEGCPQLELAVLDVVMPNLDGVSAGQQMLEVRPELPVLYLTGYADKLDKQQVLPAEAEVLTKPATMAELSWKIHQLLRR